MGRQYNECKNCFIYYLFKDSQKNGAKKVEGGILKKITGCERKCSLERYAQSIHPRHLMQMALIGEYKKRESSHGRNISIEDAANEWISRYAGKFAEIYPYGREPGDLVNMFNKFKEELNNG